MSVIKHVYNWKKDNQVKYSAISIHQHPGFKLSAAPLPPSVDLRPFCSPIENQGQIGSCTGHALVGAMEFLENKLAIDRLDGQFTRLSRLFVYYNERSIEGDVGQDNGAEIYDGINALANLGICTETVWPYIETQFATVPTTTAFQDALSRKITAYAKVPQDIQSIKTTLVSGYPIVFGFMVYEAFESDIVAQTGILNMPTPQEQCQGGHAVMCVGYDDAQQRVIVRNSWGTGWGMGGTGYFSMPYQYITNPILASDLWVINR